MSHIRSLVFHQNGRPEEVLGLEQHAYDTPLLQDQVRVEILAAPINPADLNTVVGNYGVKLDLPAVPGVEGAGRVVATNSKDFAVGDSVIFLRRAATWASHTIVAAESLLKIPPEMEPLQAAMLKINPATAWLLLHQFVNLQHGDWIVQNAGNSGVGRCVIQLARDLGIRTVSFVRRDRFRSELSALGADGVFNDDQDGHAAAREVLAGANAAAAFNAVGGDSALRLMKQLRQGGQHITYGAMGLKPLTVPNGLLIFRDLQLRGLWVSRWLETAPAEQIRGIYADLAQRVIAGKLQQPVDSTFKLEDFRAALARVEAPDRCGKILLMPQ
jgi:mitochondrial enoyl-[acyl-carrier protein] reductase / trans-2-enoyl-CoA reductase